MKYMKMMAWMRIDEMRMKAMEWALDIAGRHDVPRSVPGYDAEGKPRLDEKGAPIMVPVRPDLRDIQGMWYSTRDGKPIAGRIRDEELLQGSMSTVTPFLMAVVSVLSTAMALSTILATTLGGLLGLTVFGIVTVPLAVVNIATMKALWEGVGRHGTKMMMMGAVLFPLVGVSAGGAIAFSGLMSKGAWTPAIVKMLFGGLGLTNAVNFLAARGSIVIAAGVIVSIIVGVGLFTRSPWVKRVMMFFGLFSAACMLLPPALAPVFWSVFAATTAFRWEINERRLRAQYLAWMAEQYAGGNIGNISPAKRLAQAELAEKDKTQFIALGKSVGKLVSYGDGHAPDGGKAMGLTILDLRVHLHIFGETGGGKTFNAIRQVLFQWTEWGGGGILLMDGKGAAGEEFLGEFTRRFPNAGVVLIDKHADLALMEGLDPHSFTEAIADVGGAKKEEKSEGGANANADFFNNHGRNFCLTISRILEALIAEEIASGVEESKRQWHWHIQGVDKIKKALRSKDNAAHAFMRDGEKVSFEEYLIPVITLPEFAGNTERGMALKKAISDISQDYWGMPTDTFGSIVATIERWINPLMQNSDIVKWTRTEKGADLSTVLYGGVVAISLPAAEYGQAGCVVQSLVKQRIATGIRKRAGESEESWRGRGEKPVLFLVDEAHSLITKDDNVFLSQSRSLGGHACYATQSVDNYISSIGEATTLAFLGNFRSKLTFRSTPATYDYFSKSLGEGKFLTWSKRMKMVDLVGTAQRVANSPLFDPSHPDARYMRTLRRRGAGQVTYPHQVNFQVGSYQGKYDGIINSHRDVGQDADGSELKIGAVLSSEVQVRPLLTMVDCREQLNGNQDAFAMFNRAGSIRADFIHFDTVDKEQVAEMFNRFHMNLLFNNAVRTVERDIVKALGHRPSDFVLRKKALAYLTLVLDDGDFRKTYLAAESFGPELQQSLVSRLDKTEEPHSVESIKLRIYDEYKREQA